MSLQSPFKVGLFAPRWKGKHGIQGINLNMITMNAVAPGRHGSVLARPAKVIQSLLRPVGKPLILWKPPGNLQVAARIGIIPQHPVNKGAHRRIGVIHDKGQAFRPGWDSIIERGGLSS